MRLQKLKGLLTALVFFGCAAAALTYLVPGLLGSTAFGDPLGGSVAISENPLTFDAPAWTAARLDTSWKQASNTLARTKASSGDVLSLKNWSYTIFFLGRPTTSSIT